MPTILLNTLEIAKATLPQLVKELRKLNELKAIEIKAGTGMVSEPETIKAVDAVMAK